MRLQWMIACVVSAGFMACSGGDGVCGDGEIGGSEACDDSNAVNDDACTNDCKLPVCGDLLVQPGEQCDDGNTTSGDGCSATCTTEGGVVCGNGIVEAGEQCDPPDGTTCDNNCQDVVSGPVCGDGVTEGTEECDDTNLINNDGCTNGCKLPVCGDSILQAGEECDDANNIDDDSCTNNCELPSCGDNLLQNGEECDDGNVNPNDTCDNECVFVACGNAKVQANEQCDDGNTIDNDACTNACTDPVCGDSITQSGEECDDANTINDDGCTNGCKLPLCGDLILQAGEECDDANTINDDSCTNSCKLPACGDAILQSGEACDDGNLTEGDGCDADCQPSCGNGVIDAANSETCDDGGSTNGNGCDSACQVESGFGCHNEPSVCALLPIANPDTLAGLEDTLVTINAATLLANDVEPGGGALSLISVGNPTNGLALLLNNVVTFAPTANFSGTATFEYTVSNGVDTATAVVTIALTPVADAPTLTASNVTGDEDTVIPLGIQSSLVDTDGSEELTVEIAGIPSDSVLSAGTVIGTEHTMSTAAPSFVGSSIQGNLVTSVKIIDFDNDGKNDLFSIVNFGTGSQSISVLFGNGDGTLSFRSGPSTSGTLGAVTRGGVAAFFNDDPFPDVVILTDILTNLHLNDGTGEAVMTPLSGSSTVIGKAITAGRFNNDNLDDIVIAENNGSNLRIFFGNNSGALGTGTVIPGVGNIARDCLQTADLNNDGNLDLIASTSITFRVAVWLGNGDGTFSGPTSTAVSTGNKFIQAGFIDGDNNLDVAVDEQPGVRVLLGDGAGGFTGVVFSNINGGITEHNALGFINEDDILDMIMSNNGTTFVSMGNGDGTFQFEPTPFPLAGLDGAFAFGRLDGDSFDDLGVVSLTSGTSQAIGYTFLTIARDTIRLTSAELSGFSVQTPLNFFSVLPLVVRAISSELANGDTASTSANIDLTVNPVAN